MEEDVGVTVLVEDDIQSKLETESENDTMTERVRPTLSCKLLHCRGVGEVCGSGSDRWGVQSQEWISETPPPLAVPSVGRSSMGLAEDLQGLGEAVQQVPEDQSPG